MAFNDVMLLAQGTCNLVALILSLCSIIPLSLHLQCFKGHCLLFTTGVFGDDGNFKAIWSSIGYCVYTLFVSSLLLIVSLVQVVRMFTLLCKGKESSFLSAFLDCIVNLILTICMFIAAILVTVGFKTWCDAIMQRFSSCDEASVMEIDKADKIQTKGFYLHIGTVQFAVWSAWVCCVLLTVLATLKLCRYHEREIIRVSMARQRQKIIENQYEHPSPSDS